MSDHGSTTGMPHGTVKTLRNQEERSPILNVVPYHTGRRLAESCGLVRHRRVLRVVPRQSVHLHASLRVRREVGEAFIGEADPGRMRLTGVPTVDRVTTADLPDSPPWSKEGA